MKHLSKPITDEPGVVYLMAQVRKLLEKDDSTKLNKALWMYCHWALHVDLTSPGTTMDFLKRVDCWVTNTVAYLIPSGSWAPIDEYHLLREFIYLESFRHQLRGFLGGYGLPLSLCELDAVWYEFVKAYSCVIEDGTLSTKPYKEDELGAVRSVAFTKGQELTPDDHVSLIVVWTIELKDDRTLRTNMETAPAGRGKMFAHHLEVISGPFVPPEVCRG